MGKILILEYAISLGMRCWWLSPTYQMASQVWRDLKAEIRGFHNTTISETERRIDFEKGGMIAIRSTHYPDNLRGEGLDYAVLDEYAFMAPTVWSQVVRPMLTERRGGATFLSTPFGRNHFWDLYQIGLDPEEHEWSSFQLPTSENPYIKPEEIEAIQRATPERIFREEYLAQFISDAGQVFRGIEEAATAPMTATPVAGRRYIAGVDWGREHDYTVIAVIDAETAQMVALDRFNRIGWELQRGRLKTLCEVWNPAVIWAEANSIGAVNIEALQADGLPVRPFMTTAQSKRQLIEGLALAIERRELALTPDPILLAELASYTMERLPGGGYRYSAPAGSHDDTVIATALAWHGVRFGGVLVDFA
jgi:hypothetical protein